MPYIVHGDIALSQPPTGPVASQIEGFAEWARHHGYARYSRYRQVLLAACFSRWLGQRRIGVRLRAEHPARFLQWGVGASRSTAVTPPR